MRCRYATTARARMAKAGLSIISRQGSPARKRLLPFLKFHSAFFSELLMKQWVGLRRNRVISLFVANVIEPRRTAQVPDLLRIESIFGKILPDIPAHVIQPICVCRETSHGTRPPITVVVPFDHRPMGVFAPWFNPLAGIIPYALRRPPFLAPCIE